MTQCGTPVPDVNKFANGSIFVTVPVTNAATIATTSIAFIEMLGKRSALKLVDTEALVSSPCVQYGLENNQTIGLEDKNRTLRAEQFAGADVVFSSFGSEKGTESKTIITSEVMDPGPLNVSCSFESLIAHRIRERIDKAPLPNFTLFSGHLAC